MAEDSPLQVRGGPGGVRAHLSDLERTAGLLSDLADRLAGHGRDLLAVSIDPGLRAGAAVAPVTFARVEAVLAELVGGPGGLLPLAARAEALGLATRAVVEDYRRVDATVASLLAATTALTGQAIGRWAVAGLPALLLGTAAVVTSVVLSYPGEGQDEGQAAPRPAIPGPLRLLGAVTLRLLEQAGPMDAAIAVLPGVIGGLTATLPAGPLIASRIFGHPWGPAGVPEVAAGLRVIGGPIGVGTGAPAWFHETGRVAARVAAVPRRSPAGTADLVGSTVTAPGAHPMIHVERVDDPGGPHWVVSIPGTADWAPVAGRTPHDLSGNVRLMAGERASAMAGVVQAMRATGVRPGEPVLLAGHSQGGLVAVSLAADPLIRQEFSVSHVITTGAPVGSVPVPDGVQVLSLEHQEDLVPRLDGAANSDRPNWVTVTAPAPSPGGSAAGLGEPLLAHRGELYQRTAERVDRSTDPSIRQWLAGAAPFLQGGRAAGTAWDVEISRVGTT